MISLKDIEDLEQSLELFDNNIRMNMKTHLMTDGTTFWMWIYNHFAECNQLYHKLCDNAVRVFGKDGWRLVSWEAVCLWVAINRYQVDLKERLQ